MKKKIIPILALSTIALTGLASCSSDSITNYYTVSFSNIYESVAAEGDAAPFTLKNAKYAVSGNVAKAKKGEEFKITIAFDEIADVSNFSEVYVYQHSNFIQNIIDLLNKETKSSETKVDPGEYYDALPVTSKASSSSTVQPLDSHNYSFVKSEENDHEWVLTIPKEAMTQSFDVVFAVCDYDIAALYSSKSSYDPYNYWNLFKPSEIHADNILDTYGTHYVMDPTEKVSLRRNFVTYLEPNSQAGYTYTKDILDSVKVYALPTGAEDDVKNYVELKKNDDYVVELFSTLSEIPGNKVDTIDGSQGLKFTVDPAKIVTQDAKTKAYSRKYDAIYSCVTKTAAIPAVPTYVKLDNTAGSIWNIKGNDCTVSFEYEGGWDPKLKITATPKDASKSEFPSWETFENEPEKFPIKYISATSTTNALGLNYFEPFEAKVLDEEKEEKGVSITDAIFGDGNTDVQLYSSLEVPGFLDANKNPRIALFQSFDDPSAYHSSLLSYNVDEKGVLTMELAVSYLVQDLCQAGKVTDWSEYGSVNFVNSIGITIEPTAKK